MQFQCCSHDSAYIMKTSLATFSFYLLHYHKPNGKKEKKKRKIFYKVIGNN